MEPRTRRAAIALSAMASWLPIPSASGADGVVVASPRHTLLQSQAAPPLPSPSPGRSLDALAGAIRSVGFSAPALRAMGYPVVTWTPSRPTAIRDAIRAGVSGIITDRPDLAIQMLREASSDPGAATLLGPDGAADAARFDVEGHRGAAGLRPENTIPAMEAALDVGVSTLEMDVQETSDGVPILSHDTLIRSSCCRKSDGASFAPEEIRTRTLDTIQGTYICDRMPVSTSQRNGTSLSPVSNAYARERGFPDPYTPPSLRQVLDFVEYYAAWYEKGPGAGDPAAARNAAVARRVRFAVEAKGRGPDAARLAGSVIRIASSAGVTARTTIESRDPDVLRAAQADDPAVSVAWLLERKP